MARVASRVHAGLLAAQLLFAGFHVVGKAVLDHLHPLTLAALRVGCATPLLLAIAWHHDRLLPRPRDLPHLVLLGALGVFANQVLFILGLQRTTATDAAILMPSIPVFAVALAALAGIERPGLKQVAGIGLAVGGALVMLRPWEGAWMAGGTLGNALILANCLAYAAFLVAQRPLLERLPWRTVIAWSFLFGGIGVVAVAIPQLAELTPATVPAAAWAGLAYIVLFPTAVGYSLATWAVQRSTPALVAAYTTLQPLFAAALAAAFLGERLGPAEGIGFVLIAAGLALVGRRRAAPPP
ncbi:MAG TPA: DMT family transporter [Thermoanaerobaculia bacterium]|nr:DMT family transporter [Thermoanaerobaculia bacterium]